MILVKSQRTNLKEHRCCKKDKVLYWGCEAKSGIIRRHHQVVEMCRVFYLAMVLPTEKKFLTRNAQMQELMMLVSDEFQLCSTDCMTPWKTTQ